MKLLFASPMLLLSVSAMANTAQTKARADSVRSAIISGTVAQLGTGIAAINGVKLNADSPFAQDPDSINMVGSTANVATKDGRSCQISIHDSVVPFVTSHAGKEATNASVQAVAASLPAFQRIAPADFNTKLAAVAHSNAFLSFFTVSTPALDFDTLRMDMEDVTDFDNWNISVQCAKAGRKSAAEFSAASYGGKAVVYAANAALQAVEADEFTPDVTDDTPAPEHHDFHEHHFDRDDHDDRDNRGDRDNHDNHFDRNDQADRNQHADHPEMHRQDGGEQPRFQRPAGPAPVQVAPPSQAPSAVPGLALPSPAPQGFPRGGGGPLGGPGARGFGADKK